MMLQHRQAPSTYAKHMYKNLIDLFSISAYALLQQQMKKKNAMQSGTARRYTVAVNLPGKKRVEGYRNDSIRSWWRIYWFFGWSTIICLHFDFTSCHGIRHIWPLTSSWFNRNFTIKNIIESLQFWNWSLYINFSLLILGAYTRFQKVLLPRRWERGTFER